ncbi:AP-1 complex-associated regulatory protein-like isoform X4 [Haliotis rufescens]|uniref:AP-1 complex-associated regulatory protein-like isoform X4 n=1 Tax=Haliotis rufescens TaxID=6454 RepID=UPI00201F7BB1|nr:AP-1 complex-associated regulatory protein-like isoform X4 [Haliotis rufescens]
MIVVSFNMGNCLRKCCGLFDKRRKYLKTRYNVERDFSIEFENLMDDEPQDDMNRGQLELTSGPFTVSNYVKWLAQQEEEIEREEEAYYEAKREAARITKLQRAKEAAAKKNATTNGPRSWLGDEDDWEVAGGEDDFEIFLASVKARSLAARAQLRQGSGDGQSSSSSTAHRDKTEGSSLDLEWEHEAGVVPQLRQRSSTEENLVGLTKDSPMNSNDLEWDNDFVSAEELEKEQLISHSNVR